MHKIHQTASVHPEAQLGNDVSVGPYTLVGPDVVVGDRTIIEAQVVIEPGTRIGADCHIRAGALLGGAPQDHKFKGENTLLVIGERNIIREYVTIHRSTGEGTETRIGDDNMLMAYSHIGHNCRLGSNVTLANMVGISGHVVVEDRVVIGGIVGIHQYVRIGKLAMLGGFSKVVQDVPPFMMADGRPTKVYGLNTLGLRRSGIAANVRADLKQCFKLIYRSDLNLSQAIESMEREVEPSAEREYLLEFLRNVKFGFGGRQLDNPR